MTREEIQSLRLAAQSPWHFLSTHVRTHDPKRGVFTYPRFDYLQELVDIVSREQFLLVPKSRQLMVTWTMVAFFLWRALFRGPGMYIFLSRNERCAEELLERTRFILDHLPAYMQPRRTTNSREEIAFGKIGSRILSLPASPNGPRMYSPTGVFWDEMAFTPYDEMIWTALKPALDSGGQFVGVSSSGGAHNLFAKFVLGSSVAPHGYARNLSSPSGDFIPAGTQPQRRISRFADDSVESGDSTMREKIVTAQSDTPHVFHAGIAQRSSGSRAAATSAQSAEATVPGCPESASTSTNAEANLQIRPESSNLFYIHKIHYSQHPERNNENWKHKSSAGLSLAKWNQEQEISFEAMDDLVYAEFDPVRHILPAPWNVNPQPDIYRTIDFGFRHPFILWLQRAGDDEFVVFDEWAGRDATTEQMIHAINAIDRSHGISERDVNWTACDPAGAAAQDSGISPVDYLRKAGIKLRYRSSRIQPGIQLVKAALRDAASRTTLRIAPKCATLISDFAKYKWAPHSDEPIKDGSSDHSMDALRYFFVNRESQDEMPVQGRVAGYR